MPDAKLEILLLAKDMSDRQFATFQGHITRAESSVSRLSGTMKAFGAAAVAAIGAAAVAGLEKAIDSASDLNETLSKSTTLFGGDVADQVARWGENAARSMGLSKQAAIEATATMGNMFSQLGAGSDRAAALSMNMIQLSADIASYHNVAGGAQEVSEAMQSAFRGEYDALQRYIPTINAAAVKQQALADTGKKSADDLTDLEKAIAAVEIITRDAGVAAGDFARTSDGLANQQRIFGAQLKDLSAEIGQHFIPLATDAVHWTNEWIEKNKGLISSFAELTAATARWGAEFARNFAEFADQQFNPVRVYREYAQAITDFYDAASGEMPRMRGAQVPDDLYGMNSGELNARVDSALAKEFDSLDAQQHKLFQDAAREDAKAVKELEKQIEDLDRAISQSNANPWDPIGYDIDSGGIDEMAAAIQKIEQERNNRRLETFRNIAAQNGIEDTYDIDKGDAMAGLDEMEKKAQETSDAMRSAFTGWGSTLSSELADAVIDSNFAFEEIARSFEKMLLQMVFQKKVVEPIFESEGFQKFFGIKKNASGGVYQSQSLASYEGTVTDKPHFFTFARGAGVFGEAGWEGILPLSRMADGKLGVQAKGAGSGVVVNVINNSGAQVETQRSQTPQGEQIDVIIDRVQAGNLVRSGSYTRRAMRNAYGARDQLVVR